MKGKRSGDRLIVQLIYRANQWNVSVLKLIWALELNVYFELFVFLWAGAFSGFLCQGVKWAWPFGRSQCFSQIGSWIAQRFVAHYFAHMSSEPATSCEQRRKKKDEASHTDRQMTRKRQRRLSDRNRKCFRITFWLRQMKSICPTIFTFLTAALLPAPSTSSTRTFSLFAPPHRPTHLSEVRNKFQLFADSHRLFGLEHVTIRH